MPPAIYSEEPSARSRPSHLQAPKAVGCSNPCASALTPSALNSRLIAILSVSKYKNMSMLVCVHVSLQSRHRTTLLRIKRTYNGDVCPPYHEKNISIT